jgi:glyoxylase-like metal-dependent hydrolase (beta-lactamase superfamily II)
MDLAGGAAVFSVGGSNVLVVPGPDGLIMVDTGPMGSGEALLAAIDQFSGKAPIHAAFNTHWHYEQTGGNEAVRKRGVDIIAHENTKLWLGGDFYVRWQEKRYRPRPAEALPTKTFYAGDQTMPAGDETVTYATLFQAHTDGDIYVHFPKHNILAVGGLLSAQGYPILDYSTGGWIGGMAKANEALLKIADDATIIVCEGGAMQNKAHLQAQHDMLTTVTDRMKGMAQKGFSAEDMIEGGATDGFDDAWGDPTAFITMAYAGLVNHTYDLGGFI